MTTVERFDQHRLENWAIRMMAIGLSYDLHKYVQKKHLPYFNATMRLICNQPDIYRRKGYSLDDVRFSQHVRKGTKLVSCVADFCGGPTPSDGQIERVCKGT